MCKNIDEYISTFSIEVQKKLHELRNTIKKAAPLATESMSYQMPTFKLKRNLVHFAAYDKHIGFYPTPSGIEAFKSKLLKYKHAKGSVQFPLNESLPLNLIKRIVAYRVKEETLK